MSLIKSLLRIVRYLIGLSLMVFIVILMSSNSDIITIKLYPLPFEIETKSFIIMISFFVCGMIFGVLSCSKSILGKSFEIIGNRQIIRKLKKKLTKNK
jgi:uncharacterized integral membrane protein